MPWVVTFIISWIILIFLVDLRYIKYTIWGGIFAVLFQLFIDALAYHLELYNSVNVIIRIFDSTFFFTFGAPFCIGILYAQTYPKDLKLRFINVFVLTGLFFIMEYSLVQIGVLRYVHWHYIYSIFVDISAFLVIGNLLVKFKLLPWLRRN